MIETNFCKFEVEGRECTKSLESKTSEQFFNFFNMLLKVSTYLMHWNICQLEQITRNVETYRKKLENIFGLVDSHRLPSLGPHVHMMAPNLRKRSKLGINKYFFFILRTSSGRCRHYCFVYFYHHSLNYVTWNLHVFLMYVKELLWYEYMSRINMELK